MARPSGVLYYTQLTLLYIQQPRKFTSLGAVKQALLQHWHKQREELWKSGKIHTQVFSPSFSSSLLDSKWNNSLRPSGLAQLRTPALFLWLQKFAGRLRAEPPVAAGSKEEITDEMKTGDIRIPCHGGREGSLPAGERASCFSISISFRFHLFRAVRPRLTQTIAYCEPE